MSTLRNNIVPIILGSIIALLLLIPFSAIAKEYGPTKPAESLWNIAKSIPHDETISTIQIVYAIYKLNPDAFHSGNMNELKKDVYLQLPDDMKAVSQLSYREAKKEYRNHLQDLELLQISAKDLSKAKKNYNRWHKKYKSLRKQLETEDFLSNIAVANISTKLKTAAAKQIQWKKEVGRLRKALLKKATLQQTIDEDKAEEKIISTPTTISTHEVTSIDSSQINQDKIEVEAVTQATEIRRKTNQISQESTAIKPTQQDTDKTIQENSNLKLKLQNLEERIEKTQTSLRAKSANQDLLIFKLQNKLEESQQILREKLKTQTMMEERLTVLEDELGSKEQVILKLQSTLRTAADTMKQQQIENEKLQARLQTFEENRSTIAPSKRFEILGTQEDQALISQSNEKKVKPAPINTNKNNNNVGLLQYIVASILAMIILMFLSYKLYEVNRKRKFKKRMEVIELKLKPIETAQKTVSNPFSDKHKSPRFGYQQPRSRR